MKTFWLFLIFISINAEAQNLPIQAPVRAIITSGVLKNIPAKNKPQQSETGESKSETGESKSETGESKSDGANSAEVSIKVNEKNNNDTNNEEQESETSQNENESGGANTAPKRSEVADSRNNAENKSEQDNEDEASSQEEDVDSNKCKFVIDQGYLNKIIPPKIIEDLKKQDNPPQTESSLNCQQYGQDFAHLINHLKISTGSFSQITRQSSRINKKKTTESKDEEAKETKDEEAKETKDEEAKETKDEEAKESTDKKNPPGSPENKDKIDDNNCKKHPQRCLELVKKLQAGIDANCYKEKDKAQDTLIGAMLSLGRIMPGAAGISVGLLTAKQILNIRKKSPHESKSYFKNIDESNLSALYACSLNKSYQEAYCREVYSGCLLGDEKKLKLGYCNSNMKLDEELTACSDDDGDCSNLNEALNEACKEYKNFPKNSSTTVFKKKEMTKKDILRMCLENGKRVKDKNGVNSFEIEIKVLADIYACASYQAKKDDKGNFKDIKEKCMNGKKTIGGHDINEFTIAYNKILDGDNSSSIKVLQDDTLPQMIKQASDFHTKMISSNKLVSANDILVGLNHCTFGAGSFMANKKELPNECKKLFECAKKLPPPTDPVKDNEKMYVAQSLQEMLSPAKKEKNLDHDLLIQEKNCYSMAILQNREFIDLARELKELKSGNKGKLDCSSMKSIESNKPAESSVNGQ